MFLIHFLVHRVAPLVLMMALAVATGGCGPLVVSRRFDPALPDANAPIPCDCGNLVEHSVRCLRRRPTPLPGSEGISHGMIPEADPNTIQPPPSKFHPVPTRPVFAPGI